jgi:hypothetical protein
MLLRKLIFAAVLVCAMPAGQALAQTAPGGPYAPRQHPARPHIEITPLPYPYPRLYRRCVERLQVQYRPSGPVLYPLTYCWWARG